VSAGAKPIRRTDTDIRQAGQLVDQVSNILQGKRAVVELAVTSLIAGGHLLLEDVPGLGKTTLARALASSVGASFSRIQFTSDLLPSDILGVNVFNQSTGAFEFKRGPVFAHFVLADEINRTTPRTQSSMLEAMGEARVTIDDVTHVLPSPFLVIATQNPLEAHGTYPLPESQLDRFLMRLAIGYPDPAVEREILSNRRREEPVDDLEACMTTDELKALQLSADNVRVDDSLTDYVLAIVEATRKSPRLHVGVSTRGGLYLLRAARAYAIVMGRDYVVPDDLRHLAAPVLAHRVSVGGVEGGLGQSRRVVESIITELLSEIEAPV
jgi:MoxR-like ATPase